jgi:hypothetical protein
VVILDPPASLTTGTPVSVTSQAAAAQATGANRLTDAHSEASAAR